MRASYPEDGTYIDALIELDKAFAAKSDDKIDLAFDYLADNCRPEIYM